MKMTKMGLTVAVYIAAATAVKAESSFYFGFEYQESKASQAGTTWNASPEGLGVVGGYRYEVSDRTFVRGKIGMVNLNGTSSSGLTTYDRSFYLGAEFGYRFNDQLYSAVGVRRNKLNYTTNGVDDGEYSTEPSIAFGYEITDKVAAEIFLTKGSYQENIDAETVGFTITHNF